MSKKLILFLMVLLFGSTSFLRAEEVQIGEGTTTNSYLPSYSYYNYSLTQQIYTADEIGFGAGTITSIAFYNGGSDRTRNYDVYMVNTTKEAFDDNFDWVPMTGTPLFSGDVTMVAGEWTTITLETPFEYDGTNLLVCMDDNTGGWQSGMSCYVFETEAMQALRVYSDGTNYDPTNPSSYSGTTMDVKNQIVLNFESSTPVIPPAPDEWNPDPTAALTTLELISPEHMAQNVANPVVLIWNTDENAVEYKVEFGTTYPPATVVDWDTITTENVNYYIAGNLDVNTRYFWRVSIRNNNNTLVSPLYNFITKMDVPTNVQLTETEIFEGETTVVKWKGGQSGSGFTGELTVAEGTATSGYNPVYGLWVDDYTRSESIYPAEMIEEMNGGAITSVKFYIAQPAGAAWAPAVFNVYLTEVADATLSSYVTSANAEIVYTGALDGTGSEMVINFDTPYIYNGGNLLFGIEETTVGTYKSCYFYGIESTSSSAYGYSSASVANVPFNSSSFLPQVTFTCGGKSEPDRSLVGYNVYVDNVKYNNDVITGSQYELVGLAYNMEGYNVNVRAVYNEGESGNDTGTNIVYVSGYGSVSGTVTELLTGTPIADVAVSFNGTDEFGNIVLYSTTTNASGAYSIEGMAVGEYTLAKAYNENYEPNFADEPIAVVYNENTEVNFTLHEIYKPVYGVVAEDLGSVAMVQWSMNPITVPSNPSNPSGSDSFTEDFEGGLNGWTVLTVNTDGGQWIHSSNNLGGYDYNSLAHGGTGFAMCYSYVDYVGAYNTDSYLITPQKYDITANSTLTFWADNANDSYPENFSVCVATADNPGASDFTQVWSGGAKGEGGNDVVRHSENRYQNWRSHSINLGAYAGQSVYIAFHDVNYDEYEIWIDDVALSASKGSTRDVNYFTLYRKTLLKQGMTAQDSVVVADNLTDTAYADIAWVSMVPGMYQYGVSAVYPTLEDKGGRAIRVIDFETGDFSQGNFENNSSYPWTIASGNGGNVMKSTNGGVASSSSIISLNFAYPSDGTISFDAECMGEGTSTLWDKCIFAIDGEVMFQHGADISGWHNYSFDVEAGDHTFTWTYSKDGSVNPTGDYFAVDNITLEYEDGAANDDPVTPVVWSNILSKDMETEVTVNAIANIGSVEGATLVLANTYENITYQGTFDETGTIAFEEFRKGEYNVTVALDGYTSNYVATAVSIWDATTLNVLLSETLSPVETVLVSNTGFARWNNVIPEEKVALSYMVKLNNVFVAELTENYMQFDTDDMVIGDTYTAAVAVNYTTGMSAYTETTFTYLGCEATSTQVEELEGSVSGMDITLSWNGGTPTPPAPPTGGTTYDFESGMMGWTTIDADGDGYSWSMVSDFSGAGHNSSDAVYSASYINYVGVLNPDNYLVSPSKIAAQSGAYISFWACAQDASYPSEHFGVAVSTGSGTSANDFTTVQEWTMNAKGSGAMAPGRDGVTRAQGNWYEYTVDLSAYAGQEIWVAIRHFNCSDWFYLDVDDITLGDGSEKAISAAGEGFGTAASTLTRDWYYYDNGVNTDAIGTGGGNFWWGIMLPAGSYEGNKLTTVAAYDYMAMTGNVNIYQGGATAPAGASLGQANVTFTGSNDFVEFTFDEPVELDPSQNVWVILYNGSGATYPAAVCANTGDANGRWVSLDGSTWADLASYGLSYTFMVRAYIEQGGGSTATAIQPNKYNIFVDGELYGATAGNSFTLTATDTEEHTYTVVYVDDNYNFSCPESVSLIAGQSCDPVTDLVAMEYNYQGEDGIYVDWTEPEGTTGTAIYADGEYLGEVPAGNHPIFLTFTEMPPAGTVIEIGAVALYANCESEMVTVTVTIDVEENEVVNSIYPNPTSGDLNINATAMTHVSVYNAMGQMVYDQNVTGDNMILNMGQYEAGVYMVRIDTENGSSVKRITVVK